MPNKKVFNSFFVFVLIIIMFYVTFWFLSSKVIGEKVAQFTAEQVSKGLGQECAVSDADFQNGAVNFTDVVLDDKDRNTIISAKKVTVEINPLLALTNSKNLERTIERVAVEGANLELRERADGAWNVEDLLPKEASNADFRGEVTFSDSKVAVVFYGKEPLVVSASGIVDCSVKNKVNIDVALRHDNDEIKVKGSVDNIDTGDLSLHVKADRMDLQALKQFVPQDIPLQDPAGYAKAVDFTIKKYAGRVAVYGSAEADECKAVFYEMPVVVKHAKVMLSERELLISDAVINADGQELQADASINFTDNTFEPQDAAASVKISKLNVSSFSRFLPKDDMINKLASLAVENCTAVFSWKKQDTTIKAEFVQADVAGGRVSLTGTLVYQDTLQDAKNGISGRFAVDAEDLDLSKLPETFSQGISGKFQCLSDINIENNKVTVSANAKITGGAVYGLPFASVQAGLVIDGSDVTVPYFALMQQDGGCISAQVRIVQGELGGAFSVTNVEMLPISLSYPALAGSSGKVNAQGILSGSVVAPVAAGEVFSSNGRLLYQPYQSMNAGFSFQGGRITLNDFTMCNEQQEYQANGIIDVLGSDNNFNVKLTDVRAENIVKLLPKPPALTGNITADLHVTGNISNPGVNIMYELNEGSYNKILLSQVKGMAVLADNKLSLAETKLQAYGSEIIVEGELNNLETFDFSIKAKNIALGALPNKTSYNLEGEADFSGRLYGSTAYPVLQGTMTAKEINVNSQTINDLECEFKFSPELVSIDKLLFKQGKGILHYKGGFYLREQKVYGIAQAEKISVLFLMNIFEKEKISGISGDLDGMLIIGGSFKDPDIWLTGNVPYAYIKQYLVKDVELDVAIENKMLTINKLHAKQGEGFIAAQGSMNLRGIHHTQNMPDDGILKIDVGANNIDVGLAEELLGLPLNMQGKLSFAAQLNGTTKKPDINISVEINDITWGVTTFDKITALAIIDKDNININQAMIAKGEYKASAYGKVPFKAIEENLKNLKGNEQMDLNIKIDNADLQILSVLSKEIKQARGNIEGSLNVTGTLNEPQFFGKVNINDGFIAVKDMARPLEKIKVDILLENDKIEVNEISGKMGKGNFVTKGTANFVGWMPKNYDISLKLNELDFRNGWIRMPLNGDLRFFNNGSMPKLEGALSFNNKKIELIKIPELSDTPFFADIALDVAIDCGEKTRFSNDLLFDLFLSGKAYLKGSTLHPESDGEFDIKHGTVNYLSVSFDVSRGESKVLFGNANSFLPSIDISAETKMADISVMMYVKGKLPDVGINFSSQPKMSHEEILTMLTLGVPIAQGFESNIGGMSNYGQGEMMAFLSMGFQMKLVRNFEKSIQETFGVDDLRVVSVTLPGTVANSKNFNSFFDVTQRVRQSIYAASVSKSVDKWNSNAKIGLGYNYYNVSLGYKLASDTYLGFGANNTTGVDDREFYIRKNWTF